MEVYCIGEMLVDFLPGQEEEQYIRMAGGAPANVAAALARNGLCAGICCKVGDDDMGSFLLNAMEKERVKILCKERCQEAITTMSFVSLTKEGERSFTFARKPGADMFLTPEEVREEDIAQAAVIHGGSCSLSAQPAADAVKKALRLGQEKKKIVSFDINYRDAMWNGRKGECARAVKEILPYVDLLKISEEELSLIGGEENVFSLMEENRLTAVILTLGEKGARGFFQNTVFSVTGRPVRAVDTTGAGDAFWGGFLASLLLQGVRSAEQITKEAVKAAMEYGTDAGSLCVQKKGAIAALPRREEIEEMREMRKQKEQRPSGRHTGEGEKAYEADGMSG